MRNSILLISLISSVLVGQPSFSSGTHISGSNTDYPLSVFAIDLDSDGDVDILSASYIDKKISWFENNGAADPSFTFHGNISPTANADGAYSVYATDIDNDGDIDVLSASAEDGRINWYENNGSESFTERNITTSADGAQSVYAADIDSDGDIDVLSASFNDDKIAWYENDGAADPSFTARTITTSADAAKSVYAIDLDGDGDIDVLSASLEDDKIAWYENDGAADPSFTARTITTSADGAKSVFAADVDGDGDIDVLSASMHDDKVVWYENVLQPNRPAIWKRHHVGALPFAFEATTGDIDGDLRGVQFYVNGAQGSIQFRENPLPGAWIDLSDGTEANATVYRIEFTDGATMPATVLPCWR